jgi:cysteine-rich repeat protein
LRSASLSTLASVLVATGCTTAYEAFSVAPSSSGTGNAGGTSEVASSSATGGPGGRAPASSSSAAAGATGTGGYGGSIASAGGAAGAGGRTECGNGVVEGGEQCDDANPTPDDGCDACTCSFYVPASTHCYVMLTGDSWTWDEAEQACPAGWQIASLETLEERDAILPLFLANPEATWIGGNDKAAEGEFVWESGEPWTYGTGDPWHGGEPNNVGDEDCIELLDDNGNAFFNDDKCSDHHNRVLCEYTP